MIRHHDRRPVRSSVAVIVTLALIVVSALIAARFAPWEIAFGNLVLRAQQGASIPFPMSDSGPSPVPHSAHGYGIEPNPEVRNVVLMIGDGMGIGMASTASVAVHGPTGGLVMESAPVTGLVRTSAADNLVTDSAAAATALATGYKVPKQSVATLADGRKPATLTAAARDAGLATAVLTTSGLADATPACFLVHADSRYRYAEILTDILATDHEILIGGTWVHHHRAGHDREYLDLVDRVDEIGSAAGYHVVHDASELATAPMPILGLLPPRGGSADAHGTELTVLTGSLLDRLGGLERSFFAVIESELSDGAGHRNNVAEVVAAVREFDAAVATAVAWAERRGDTLVLVTADHDTGGLGIVDGDLATGEMTVRWSTGYHTGQWVPLFAFGPGAGRFTGVIDNNEIPVLIANLLGIDGFPARGP